MMVLMGEGRATGSDGIERDVSTLLKEAGIKPIELQEKEGRDYPDYVIACVGGGSNAAGAFYHFLDEPRTALIAAEAAGLGVNSGHSAATTFLGKPGVLHGSKSLSMQTEDGQVIEPYSISAGLDYPGIGPLHAHLYRSKRAEFISITDAEAMKSGIELCELEGIIPAIESAHALAVFNMKKFKKSEKKLSLNKLQMAKLTNGLNSIKGGSAVADGNGDNDTVLDKTVKDTHDVITGTN